MTFFRRFAYAIAGLWHCVKTEQNFRIHITAAATILIFSVFYGLESNDYPVLILTILLVLSLETINTAIERAVDLASDKPHSLAKAAKDCAAGGVLLAAIGSLAVAVFLFSDTDRLFSALSTIFTLPWLPFALLYLAACLWFILLNISKNKNKKYR